MSQTRLYSETTRRQFPYQKGDLKTFTTSRNRKKNSHPWEWGWLCGEVVSSCQIILGTGFTSVASVSTAVTMSALIVISTGGRFVARAALVVAVAMAVTISVAAVIVLVEGRIKIIVIIGWGIVSPIRRLCHRLQGKIEDGGILDSA